MNKPTPNELKLAKTQTIMQYFLTFLSLKVFMYLSDETILEECNHYAQCDLTAKQLPKNANQCYSSGAENVHLQAISVLFLE